MAAVRSTIISFTNLTLQKRIGLLVLTGLVIGLGLFSWLGIQSVRDSVDRTLEERLVLARMMASHMDDNLEHLFLHLQRATDFNGSLPSAEQFKETADSLSGILAESGISARNIILVDSSGRAIQVEPEDSGITGIDMSAYPEVAETLRSGVPTISGLVSDSLVGVPVVLISVPVADLEGVSLGVLTVLIDINQSNIGAFGETVTLGKTGYTEIVDGNGVIVARTRPASPPAMFEMSDHPGRFAELINQGQATVGVCHRCHEANETLQRRKDILAFAPMSTASWGVAIRQAEEEALAPTQQLGQRLLFLGVLLVLGVSLLAWTVMQGIVKPIRVLTSATKRVAAGEFKAVVPTRRQDEIGQLSVSFYNMTQELSKSRNELLLRNEELSALNSIAGTVSQSLNLKDVLENALERVLEVTRTAFGCVFLRGPDDKKLEMMSCIGSADVFKCREAGSGEANCACHQVLRDGYALMVNDVSQCPELVNDMVIKEDNDGFVSVPLKSKDKTLGIMNIACSKERPFTEDDFRLLSSIGYHVGLAIENSVLYEEAKQKEKLRGQLLNSVINAQEEERRRVARELHDEYGQTLTGLLVSIEALENMTPSEQVHLREKLENAKSLLVHALEDLRRMTLDLRPSALDDLGLITAIRAHVHRHLESAGIQVKFKSNGLNRRLASAVETALFRMVQEATYNIAKHAQARHVKIQLEITGDKIITVVEDDGKGFDVEAVFRSRVETNSLGLLGIQERAALLGGTFSIKSEVGQGTRIVVEIPIASSIGESSLVETK
ncbi:MAG: GAF domain-containing protein [Dehalococcoidales bacterium]|nr:GAF domain-containing protein [Dehalococcoidales bacterium]